MSEKSNSKSAALILAAGKGTRMMSSLPKVMHQILGLPMLWYSLNTFKKMDFEKTFIVAGHGRDILESEFSEHKSNFIIQHKQSGTGHALQISWPAIEESGAQWVVVANGDTPLVTVEHIQLLMDSVKDSNAHGGLLTLKLSDPQNYGRIIRDDTGRVMSIIEAKDYQDDMHGPFSGEINTGIYIFKIDALKDILFDLDRNNQQNEVYITQLVSLAYNNGLEFSAVCAGNSSELLGINNPKELCEQEEFLRKKIVNFYFEKGVTLRNAEQIRIGPEVVIEPGVDISGPCEIYGTSMINRGTTINSHCYIKDSEIQGSNILSFSHIDKSRIGKGCSIGPFARLRPGSVFKDESKAGNFVEIKNSTIGISSKVNHLSVGAGSTITVDVPEDSLAITRGKQKNLLRKNPLKKKQNKSNL
ncbi:MAG: NTP transferase domain-containing protein [Desulfovibrionales bacterium]|nr:NTP transferase domain-containing protein [Desulfovibrionales bacterium]